MKYISVPIKEIVELLLRKVRFLAPSIRGMRANYSLEVSSLENNGLHLVENFLSKDECEKYIDIIDRYLSSDKVNIWRDEQGADQRLYFIDELNEDMSKFLHNKYFTDILKAYTGNINSHGMLLAAKIDSIDGNVGSGGGWHRDSPVSQQLKAICYLSDVSADNGPFQYVQGSNSKSDVFKSYFKRFFDFGQYRFSENEVDNYLKGTSNTVTDIVGDAGTLVFADTKGIHRGKPISTGTRYALFCYFWPNGIPAHFQDLKQK